jgi:hypothetical protein
MTNADCFFWKAALLPVVLDSFAQLAREVFDVDAGTAVDLGWVLTSQERDVATRHAAGNADHSITGGRTAAHRGLPL